MNKELLEIWKYDVFQKVNTEKEKEETKGKWKIDFLYGEITEKGTRELPMHWPAVIKYTLRQI